jgi:hydroxyacylglutathione hydrolase
LNYTPEFTDKDISLYKFVSGPYSNNAYLIVCKHTNKSVIIDAPGDPNDLMSAAQTTKTEMLLITHNHWDHLLGYKEIISRFSLKTGIGAKDSNGMTPDVPNFQICDDEILSVGKMDIKAIHTPGHTSGSTCFFINNILFTGDTLFPGGPGKTKSNEDFKAIVKSISTKLLLLKPSVVFYPGHGPQGTIKNARKDYSIFEQNCSSLEIHGDIEWIN